MAVKLKIKYDVFSGTSDDVKRIVEIFSGYGYDVYPVDAMLAWGAYSESVYVGWAKLHENDLDVYDVLKWYLKLDEEFN
jgi:hypothetical protein